MAEHLSNFEVVLAPRSRDDLRDLQAFIAQSSPQNAERVVMRLLDAIESLSVLPRRCRIAPEAACTGGEVRQLIVLGYRVLFEIRERQVWVLTVRHGRRLPAKRLT